MRKPSQNSDAQTEAEELISKICSPEEKIVKERASPAENLAKCENLEDELLRMKQEAQLQQDTEILHGEGVDSELKLKQEKELASAASRFAECRKTIESLGLQLKSLATSEDFLLDSENTMELTCEVTPPGPKDGGEQLNPSITIGKSRNSFGRFYPRSKGVSRTEIH